MAHDLEAWYRDHQADYCRVKDRLRAARNVVLHGRKDAAIRMLKRSTDFAVLSIQTEKDRHEDAFTAMHNGLSINMAAGDTVYGNKKTRWLHESRASFDYGAAIDVLRSAGPKDALQYIVDNFTGLSYTKGAFSLAMIGIWELACPDSRVKSLLDIEGRGRVRSMSGYEQMLDRIDEAVDVNAPMFLKQWAMYSYVGGEHVTHMPFYREIFPVRVP